MKSDFSILEVNHSVFYVAKNKKINRILKNVKIIVIRFSRKNKNLTLSMPCSKCQEFLSILGIKQVYYSTECGKIINNKVCNLPPHSSKLSRYNMERKAQKM